MGDKDLKSRVAQILNCNENELIWSKYCRNPETNYHAEDGTIKGQEGYYVKELKPST